MPDEFTDLFAEWGYDVEGNPLSLVVEPYVGRSAKGDVFGPPESLPGTPQAEQVALVRSSDGNELTSQATVWARVGLADKFPLHSRVTFASGRTAVVINRAVPSIGADLALACVVVSCA